MSIRFALAGALLATLTMASNTAAQIQAYAGNDEDRTMTSVFLFSGNFDVHGIVSVHYTAPEWKESHLELLKSAKPGTRARLGKNMWTTLDTRCDLMFGDKKVAAGVYYVAAEMGKEGAINLLLLDPKEVTAQKINPMTSSMAKGGVSIPMKTKMDMKSQPKMSIELKAADNPTNLGLFIRWGPVQAVAKMTAQVKE